ncbi:MAG: sigma-54 dependent transcriptional regulator [Acidobacteria bacterium]|nr:sigma-54 dependent transcriptional regulator [Acidobacteriota bacterium]
MPGSRTLLLVVEDDRLHADQLRWALGEHYALQFAADRDSGVAALAESAPDLVLLDLCMPPEMSPEAGLAVLRAVRARDPDTPVVVMSALEEREPALRAVEQGAWDFFTKPIDVAALKVVFSRALERQALARENRRLRADLEQRFQVEGIVGASPAMVRVLEAIRRVADSPVTVTIEGESGTGKELVARAIHYSGARRNGPFVAVHCAALPDSLVESELFGHEKGAFTGADAPRVGRFEAARGGTLFLDEIATLPPAVQVKLLRVLEERAVVRLGSNELRPVDIRLVVATNESLEARVARKEFREDLLFRIRGFPILVPPLRERREDIPLLAEHFLRTACERDGRPAKHLDPEARRELTARRWPGNVRELLHAMENLALTVDRETVRPEDLPPPPESLPPLGAMNEAPSDFRTAVLRFERQLLEGAIAREGGVKARAARALGLDPAQMKYLVRKHGLK